MAINSTSSATSAAAAPTTGPGKGSVIDVAGLVSKLDQIEQVPIDRLEAKVTKQDSAIRDLAIIKDRMSMFQAALQDFTDPFSYLKKSVTSSNPTFVSTSISNSSSVTAGVFNVVVDKLAKTSTATFAFDFSAAGSIILKASDAELTEQQVEAATISLAKTGEAGIDTLEELRNEINKRSAITKVSATIINTGSQTVLSITSTTGGAASEVELINTDEIIGIEMDLVQEGADAEFTINGQAFTRPSNTVDEALAGVRLQLQGEGPVTIMAASDNREIAQTLMGNVVQAYNFLMASYTEFSKFSADPAKRGSLYGFMELRGMMDSISMSFMSPLKRSSGADIEDADNNPLSFTTLGLELQRDGTLLFKSAAFESAVGRGALDQLANGTVSPTRVAVNNAMTFGMGLDGFTTFYEKERLTLSSRISELETRKAEKMARYQAQYAALDALLFRLQALNNSLTPTFEALNNPRRQ
jgi:flagellar hook-associated protein 2